MPEKTKESKELKEKKEATSKKAAKSSSKSSTKKSNNSKKKTVSSKKVSPKVSDSKKATKIKSTASTTKKTTSNRTAKSETKKDIDKKLEVKPKKELKTKKEAVKEETVIEKIKSFLAKIISMQEEAKSEIDIKNEKSKNIDEEKKIDKKKIENKEKKSYMLEYYDLPYRYNETIVKILAQTPKKLFVYWDISDNDREKYLKAFGESFFEDTYPVLLVHNEEKKYTFEVAINDFANSWYIDINDAKSTYVIELGRKFKSKPEIVNIAKSEETKDIVLHNDYVPITISNVLEVPNDCILFKNLPRKILYRNVKNNQENFVDIENIGFINDIEHIYSINEFYKEFYKDELEEKNMLHLLNPSSMSSSTFK